MLQIHSIIESIAIHQVGNKALEEPLSVSKTLTECSDEVKALLKDYFFQAFKTEAYYQFYHDMELNMNEVFVCVGRIFESPKNLYEESLHLAKHLYEQSEHPKVKGGGILCGLSD